MGVLFALVMFSNFLSSLTNALQEIKRINVARYTEETNIREFLRYRHVSPQISNRVWHFYRKHYKTRRVLRCEKDINFFSDLPRSIRSEMYQEIYAPELMRLHVF